MKQRERVGYVTGYEEPTGDERAREARAAAYIADMVLLRWATDAHWCGCPLGALPHTNERPLVSEAYMSFPPERQPHWEWLRGFICGFEMGPSEPAGPAGTTHYRGRVLGELYRQRFGAHRAERAS